MVRLKPFRKRKDWRERASDNGEGRRHSSDRGGALMSTDEYIAWHARQCEDPPTDFDDELSDEERLPPVSRWFDSAGWVANSDDELEWRPSTPDRPQARRSHRSRGDGGWSLGRGVTSCASRAGVAADPEAKPRSRRSPPRRSGLSVRRPVVSFDDAWKDAEAAASARASASQAEVSPSLVRTSDGCWSEMHRPPVAGGRDSLCGLPVGGHAAPLVPARDGTSDVNESTPFYFLSFNFSPCMS